jgi:hypothetical protein
MTGAFLILKSGSGPLLSNYAKCPSPSNLSALNLQEDSVITILDDARKARNEVAHELTLGLDRCLDSLPEESEKYLVNSLRTLSTRLAEGDRIVSYLLSVETNEDIPNAAFLKNYPRTVAKWVCNL